MSLQANYPTRTVDDMNAPKRRRLHSEVFEQTEPSYDNYSDLTQADIYEPEPYRPNFDATHYGYVEPSDFSMKEASMTQELEIMDYGKNQRIIKVRSVHETDITMPIHPSNQMPGNLDNYLDVLRNKDEN